MVSNQEQDNDHALHSMSVQIPSSAKGSKPPVPRKSLLIVSIYALLVTLSIFIYAAIINDEFRWFVFYPILDGLIVTGLCLAIAKVYHYLKNNQ